MTVKCLVTDIILRELAYGACQHGDLFSIGDCYVVNAKGYLRGDVHDEKIPTLYYTANSSKYFERRSVLIFKQDEVRLNAAAEQHIGTSHKLPGNRA